MKAEGFKKLAVLLHTPRLGYLPYRVTSTLLEMRICCSTIEDGYWLLDKATQYCS